MLNFKLKSLYQCYHMAYIIKCYGITKDPESNDYNMLVMQFASGGDLHVYLKRNFTKITWNKQKLTILWQISKGYFMFKHLLRTFRLRELLICSDILLIYIFLS